jgi:hypothetical protein
VNERKKVTVAGVPVTVTVVGRELVVQVGRFDPQAAGPLRVNALSGTAVVAVYVAGEGGPDGAGERWVAGLYPAPLGASAVTSGTRPEVTSDVPPQPGHGRGQARRATARGPAAGPPEPGAPSAGPHRGAAPNVNP